MYLILKYDKEEGNKIKAGNDIGRNDPCLCGSGKKYKKCCLRRMENQNRKWRNSEYKSKESHWFKEEVEEMDTEEIIDRLFYFGVFFSKEGFLQDIEKFNSVQELAESWFEKYEIRAKRFDQDFLFVAARVLWDRLAPDKISDEKIDDLMQKGYELIYNEDKLHKGCDIWLQVWDLLKERIPEEITDIYVANEIIKLTQFPSNWVQDMEMELYNAGGNRKNGNREYYQKLIQFCREILEYFPESGDDIDFSMRRTIAEAYFKSGKREKAEKKFKNLVEKYPKNAFSYIGWGDMYYDSGHNNREEIKKAAKLYKKALGKEHDEVARERLDDLKNQHDIDDS